MVKANPTHPIPEELKMTPADEQPQSHVFRGRIGVLGQILRRLHVLDLDLLHLHLDLAR